MNAKQINQKISEMMLNEIHTKEKVFAPNGRWSTESVEMFCREQAQDIAQSICFELISENKEKQWEAIEECAALYTVTTSLERIVDNEGTASVKFTYRNFIRALEEFLSKIAIEQQKTHENLKQIKGIIFGDLSRNGSEL